MKRQQADLLARMTEAHTNLSVFEALIAILEGGTLSASAQPECFQIIARCKKAQQKHFRRFERAHAALTAGKSQNSGEQNG